MIRLERALGCCSFIRTHPQLNEKKFIPLKFNSNALLDAGQNVPVTRFDGGFCPSA